MVFENSYALTRARVPDLYYSYAIIKIYSRGTVERPRYNSIAFGRKVQTHYFSGVSLGLLNFTFKVTISFPVSRSQSFAV